MAIGKAAEREVDVILRVCLMGLRLKGELQLAHTERLVGTSGEVYMHGTALLLVEHVARHHVYPRRYALGIRAREIAAEK